MAKNRIVNIYKEPITFTNIEKMWLTIRKTCKNKVGVYNFSLNKNVNIYTIGKILLEKRYTPYPYRLFMIFEPKPRLVMSQSVFDKIVNHFVANFYLLPYLDKKLLDCNVATRKGKGTKYAIYLLKRYIHEIRMKEPYKNIYVLKLDIKKYFYNINHEILMNLLKKDIQDEDVLRLIKVIIDETDKPYINKIVDEINNYYHMDMPYYQKGVGLSIGAMTSQFFAVYYLNNLDHYIKEKLKCKHFIRYMDDIVILDTDKDKLKRIWKILEGEIHKLKLEVNPKSNIFNLNNGFTFVGYKYQIKNNKFVMSYNKKTKKRIKKKLNNLKKKDLIKYYRSSASYHGYFSVIKNVERGFSMKPIEKYQTYKEKYSKSIVFIRDGKFFSTFLDDVIIMWNLFDYKWHNDSISFGDSASRKVYDYLKKNHISYVVVNNETIYINGDDKIYELYVDIAKRNYERYTRRKNIDEIIDKLLENNLDNDKIILKTMNDLVNNIEITDNLS